MTLGLRRSRRNMSWKSVRHSARSEAQRSLTDDAILPPTLQVLDATLHSGYGTAASKKNSVRADHRVPVGYRFLPSFSMGTFPLWVALAA